MNNFDHSTSAYSYTESADMQNSSMMYPKKIKKRFDFDKKDFIFLLLLTALSFIYMRIGLLCGFNAGFSLSYIVLAAAAFVYVAKKGRNTVFSTVLFILSLILAATFTLNDDLVVKAIDVLALLVMTSLYLNGISDNLNNTDGSLMYLTDSFIASLYLSFADFIVPFRSIKSGNNKKRFLSVFIGVIISLPLLCIVLPLLASSDAAFNTMMSSVIKHAGIIITAVILTVIFVPFLYAFLFSARRSDARSDKARNIRYLNVSQTVINTVITVLSASYILYLISQLAYVSDAFAFLLPEDYSASRFAREGFFQMCVVAFINLLIITATSIIIKHRENGKVPVLTKCIHVFLCLFTEFYIVTAFLRMSKYISLYGLTRLRVFTSVFILCLALIFIITLIRVISEKFKYIKPLIIICVLTLIAVSSVDVDTFISKYNYEAYKEGKISLTMSDIKDLGAGQIPVLYDLYKNNKGLSDYYLESLIFASYSYDEDIFGLDLEYDVDRTPSIFDFNVPKNRGRDILIEVKKENKDFDFSEFDNTCSSLSYYLDELPLKTSVKFYSQSSGDVQLKYRIVSLGSEALSEDRYCGYSLDNSTKEEFKDLFNKFKKSVNENNGDINKNFDVKPAYDGTLNFDYCENENGSFSLYLIDRDNKILCIMDYLIVE